MFNLLETSDDLDLTDITTRIKKLNGEVEMLEEEKDELESKLNS